MFNKILLIDSKNVLVYFLKQSLAAEGYEVTIAPSLTDAAKQIKKIEPNLIIANGLGKKQEWLALIEKLANDTPAIILTAKTISSNSYTHQYLTFPFAFQDLLLLAQDILYQRTLVGHNPSQLSAEGLETVETILDELRENLRARCIILSSSSGRLIKTVGTIEQGVTISLAALMSAGFSATARAAQLLGHGEMFDSSLQESEGYGLYAIRLYERLILSVAFSDTITVGMVRHYTAQAAVDILEMLAQEAQTNDAGENEFELDDDFRDTVNQALGNILKD